MSETERLARSQEPPESGVSQENAMESAPLETSPGQTADPVAEPSGDTPDSGDQLSGEEGQTLFCVQCGTSMTAGQRFCTNCGWDSTRQQGVGPRPLPRLVDPNPSERKRLPALLLCILLGWAGAHRFYVGKVGSGLLWLFTFGLIGVGIVYDIVLIATGEFRDDQGRRVFCWE